MLLLCVQKFLLGVSSAFERAREQFLNAYDVNTCSQSHCVSLARFFGPTYQTTHLPTSQPTPLTDCHPSTSSYAQNTCLMFEQSTLNSSCLSHLAICAYAHVPLVAAGCKCSGEPDGDILCACFQNRQPLQFRASQSVQAPAGLSKATILSHVRLPCKGIKRARS